jgi:hypothetical protein
MAVRMALCRFLFVRGFPGTQIKALQLMGRCIQDTEIHSHIYETGGGVKLSSTVSDLPDLVI